MKGLIKRWIKEAMNDMEGMTDTPQAMMVDKPYPAVPPPMTAHQMVGNMSTSMATIYRIDNGFIISMHMKDERHLGSRGTLVFAKDAEELAQQIVANEARFKLGVGNGERTGSGGIGAAQAPAATAWKPSLMLHESSSQKMKEELLKQYKYAHKGALYDV